MINVQRMFPGKGNPGGVAYTLKCITIGFQVFSPTLPRWFHQNLQSSIGQNLHGTTEEELIT